jgi:hypothetical protein
MPYSFPIPSRSHGGWRLQADAKTLWVIGLERTTQYSQSLTVGAALHDHSPPAVKRAGWFDSDLSPLNESHLGPPEQSQMGTWRAQGSEERIRFVGGAGGNEKDTRRWGAEETLGEDRLPGRRKIVGLSEPRHRRLKTLSLCFWFLCHWLRHALCRCNLAPGAPSEGLRLPVSHAGWMVG